MRICIQPFARALMCYVVDRRSIAVNYEHVLIAFACVSKMLSKAYWDSYGCV